MPSYLLHNLGNQRPNWLSLLVVLRASPFQPDLEEGVGHARDHHKQEVNRLPWGRWEQAGGISGQSTAPGHQGHKILLSH